jgi:hypothetical protein
MILDDAFPSLMASVRLRLPFAIALLLLDGAGGPDRKKSASPQNNKEQKEEAMLYERLRRLLWPSLMGSAPSVQSCVD